MKKVDVVILTERRYVNPVENNKYIENVLLEDDLVKIALENQGLKVLRLSWDDSGFNWSTTKYILFRTTWDYFDRFTEFSTWLENVSKQTKLLNSKDIIHWNLDKHYLLDLQQKGIHICESFFVEKGTSFSLLEISEKLQLNNFILKPCVSGGGRHTYKINKESIEKHNTIFNNLISKEAMIIQPFQHNIIDKGEISLVIINGVYTHAVLKIAKKGDFRVQDDFGGSVHNYTPNKKEISFAEKCIEACSETPIYARVDIFIDNNNELALAELELIEPELWFRNHTNAADKLANAIKILID